MNFCSPRPCMCACSPVARLCRVFTLHLGVDCHAVINFSCRHAWNMAALSTGRNGLPPAPRTTHRDANKNVARWCYGDLQYLRASSTAHDDPGSCLASLQVSGKALEYQAGHAQWRRHMGSRIWADDLFVQPSLSPEVRASIVKLIQNAVPWPHPDLWRPTFRLLPAAHT